MRRRRKKRKHAERSDQDPVIAVPTKTPTTPEGEQVGLRCRDCGCRHFNVYYTRGSRDGVIIRRRACRNCGRMILTREIVV